MLHPQIWKFVKPPSQLCPRTALPAARDTQTTRRGPGPHKWLIDASGKSQSRYGEGGRDLPTLLSVAQGNTSPSSQEAPPGTPLQVLALSTGPGKSFRASVPLHGCSLPETQCPLFCLVSLSSPRSQLKSSLLEGLLGPPNAHSTTTPTRLSLCYRLILRHLALGSRSLPLLKGCLCHQSLHHTEPGPGVQNHELNELMSSDLKERDGPSPPTCPLYLGQSPVDEKASSPSHPAFSSPAAPISGGSGWGAAYSLNCCLCANQAAWASPFHLRGPQGASRGLRELSCHRNLGNLTQERGGRCITVGLITTD